jgi:hypothetical protein
MIKNGEWSHCRIRLELKILRTKEQNPEKNYNKMFNNDKK